MSVVLDQLPPDEVAAILSAVTASKHPQGDLPTIALNHHLTLAQLQQLLRGHGYPDKDVMRRRIQGLLDKAATAIDPDRLRAAHLPIGQVLPDPNNLREDLGAIDELADSLESVGMLEPIVVRRVAGGFVIVAGHRRRAAAAILRWQSVPVVVADLRPDEVLVAMLIENGQREDLDPIEEARALERLRCQDPDALKTHGQLAQLIGRSQPYVSGRLALLELTEDDQAAIRAGHLGVTEGTRRGRRKGNFHRPGAAGKKSAAHFDTLHQLAPAARVLCRTNGHNKHTAGGIIGGVACGFCWEAAIRGDEAGKVERRLRAPAS